MTVSLFGENRHITDQYLMKVKILIAMKCCMLMALPVSTQTYISFVLNMTVILKLAVRCGFESREDSVLCKVDKSECGGPCIS